MKTKIISLVALLAIQSAAHAQNLAQSQFSGSADVRLTFDTANYEKAEMYSIKSTLIVSPWSKENDKIVAILDLQGGKRGCIGSETTYIGYETAFNIYDLYLKNGNNMPTPSNATAIGMLTITKSDAHLHLTSGFKSTTTNLRGDCVYSIPGDSLITLPSSNDE